MSATSFSAEEFPVTKARGPSTKHRQNSLHFLPLQISVEKRKSSIIQRKLQASRIVILHVMLENKRLSIQNLDPTWLQG